MDKFWIFHFLLYSCFIITLGVNCASTDDFKKSVTAKSVIPVDVLKQLANITTHEEFIFRFVEQGNDTFVNTSDVLGDKLFPDPLAASPDLNGVGAAVALLPEKAGCETVNVSVALPKHSSAQVMYWPSCVTLRQCAGCCGDDILNCIPTKMRDVKVGPVMKLRYDLDLRKMMYEGSIEVTMQEHDACSCECRVQEFHCNSVKHIYLPGACRCECKNEGEDNTCRHNQKWDDYNCECACREIPQCFDHEIFIKQTCSCASISDFLIPDNASSVCPGTVCRAGYRPVAISATECECRVSTQWGAAPASFPGGDSVAPVDSPIPAVDQEPSTTLPPTRAPARRPRPRPSRRRALPGRRKRKRRNVSIDEYFS